jgi:hypothetical protein
MPSWRETGGATRIVSRSRPPFVAQGRCDGVERHAASPVLVRIADRRTFRQEIVTGWRDRGVYRIGQAAARVVT